MNNSIKKSEKNGSMVSLAVKVPGENTLNEKKIMRSSKIKDKTIGGNPTSYHKKVKSILSNAPSSI